MPCFLKGWLAWFSDPCDCSPFPREREIFELVTAGWLNKQISKELAVAERTVKAHRANIMQKMEAESLAEQPGIPPLRRD